ncbi:Small nuclear RNA activating complex (SNAPc)-subunit SNAP43 protein [Striga hermonthica]|uniref:Small nuclear RNA activating complex (SNAPc)-subunit SNAP43 protein n=1 Tax=Striga hermonthica TaxID=68872 RepID=A0A9N7RJK3_STRHE|nr:Small nuclear RNA activating complex (SNAPc)-subunit SNAP43 protein [Striga hermonthica]
MSNRKLNYYFFFFHHKGTELDVNLLKEKSSDYALAKEIALKEAGQVIDVENIKHIVENKKVIGEVVEKAATDWNSEKEMLYERTGLPVALPQDNEEEEENEYERYNQNMQNGNKEEEADTFGKELEVLLTKEG